jgi:putative transposase
MSYELAEGYKIRKQAATHFLTFTIVGWIDLFSRQRYRDMVLDSFRYCQQNKELKIHGYVIMSNHIHTIWTAGNGRLSDTIRDFKTYTSKAFITTIEQEAESRREWLLHMFKYFGRGSASNKVYKVWKNDSHPEEIYAGRFFLQKLNYIHLNPVRAGIVKNTEDYIYSSASNYETGNGIFAVDSWY